MVKKIANPIKYTRQERSKIYKAKKIKSSVLAVNVSKQQEEREKQIIAYLKKVQNEIYCPAMKSIVTILRKGKMETANKAKLSVKSTISALNLEDTIKNAIYIRPLKPKKNKSQSCFKKLHLLICPIASYGFAKIIIGEFYTTTKLPTKYTHYCVTNITLRELKM